MILSETGKARVACLREDLKITAETLRRILAAKRTWHITQWSQSFLQGLTLKSQDFTDFWSIWMRYLMIFARSEMQLNRAEMTWQTGYPSASLNSANVRPEGCQSICEDHRQTRDKHPNIYRKKTEVEVIRAWWVRKGAQSFSPEKKDTGGLELG